MKPVLVALSSGSFSLFVNFASADKSIELPVTTTTKDVSGDYMLP